MKVDAKPEDSPKVAALWSDMAMLSIIRARIGLAKQAARDLRQDFPGPRLLEILGNMLSINTNFGFPVSNLGAP